jgi:uncharacterized protein YcbK (DUF882 family)
MGIDQHLSEHFQLWEFLHNKSPEGVTPVILSNLRALSARLEVARRLCGNRPVRITSGFRTVAHNRAVGGDPDSQHLLGKAADITVDGLTPAQVQKELALWDGGLGSYAAWTHLDLGSKRRWSE